MKLVPALEIGAAFLSLPERALRRLLGKADRVSFALRGQRVTALPGRKVQVRVAKELSFLAGSKVDTMYSASRWLGTARRASLIVLLEPSMSLKEHLLRPSNLVSPLGEWEDVAFYSGQHVLLWTCTHECEGVVHGSHAELIEWGLVPKPAVEIRVAAERLDSSACAAILELAAAY